MKITPIAERDGRWWAVRVPEVDGVYTQAATLDEVADMARSATALMLDLDPATIDIPRIEVHQPTPEPKE